LRERKNGADFPDEDDKEKGERKKDWELEFSLRATKSKGWAIGGTGE